MGCVVSGAPTYLALASARRCCRQAAERLRAGSAAVPPALAAPLAALIEGAIEIARQDPEYALHAINAEDAARALLGELVEEEG
jgi:hypothetical protein